MNTLDFSYFPPSPVEASTRLVPLESWYEVVHEAGHTGIEFDDFWLESVRERVAYFFSWRGITRATVLVVWDTGQLKHVECRTIGDSQPTDEDTGLIEAEVNRLFILAGFQVQRVCQ